MADELSVAEEWIAATLAADPTVSSYVGARIFDRPPPEGTEYPYIIFSHASNSDVRGVGTARVMSDTIYLVKAVAGTDHSDALADVAEAIESALTTAQPVATTDGYVEGCVRERMVRYTEYTDGETYAHRGGEYKLIATMS